MAKDGKPFGVVPAWAKKEEKDPQMRFPPMAAYIYPDGHLRIRHPETGEEMRVVPAPFMKPSLKKIPSTNASGWTVGYDIPEEIKQEVDIMAYAGLTVETIADCFGLDRATVEKHFADAIMTGHARISYAMARVLVMKALRGDTAAAIYLTKARQAWTDLPQEAEVTFNLQDSMSVAVKVAPERAAAFLSTIPNLKELLLGKHANPDTNNAIKKALENKREVTPERAE